ncbi:MAG: hypothetical protein AB7F28_04115 [Candidatus Margulisiibacteriota bacterium]
MISKKWISSPANAPQTPPDLGYDTQVSKAPDLNQFFNGIYTNVIPDDQREAIREVISSIPETSLNLIRTILSEFFPQPYAFAPVIAFLKVFRDRSPIIDIQMADDLRNALRNVHKPETHLSTKLLDTVLSLSDKRRVGVCKAAETALKEAPVEDRHLVIEAISTLALTEISALPKVLSKQIRPEDSNLTRTNIITIFHHINNSSSFRQLFAEITEMRTSALIQELADSLRSNKSTDIQTLVADAKRRLTLIEHPDTPSIKHPITWSPAVLQVG